MARKDLRKGLFVTFEGPEGCGKSTHSRLACEYLEGKGYACVAVREPGGTALGEAIRGILLDSKGLEISDLSELFLFEAARSQIIDEKVAPALKEGAVVICDRFSDATLAYQGYAGGVDRKIITKIDSIATRGLKPDLTILLDIDTRLGLARATMLKKDRMERKGISYHEKVRRGYLAIARSDPGRIKVIKVDSDISETQKLVRREIDSALKRHKRPA